MATGKQTSPSRGRPHKASSSKVSGTPRPISRVRKAVLESAGRRHPEPVQEPVQDTSYQSRKGDHQVKGKKTGKRVSFEEEKKTRKIAPSAPDVPEIDTQHTAPFKHDKGLQPSLFDPPNATNPYQAASSLESFLSPLRLNVASSQPTKALFSPTRAGQGGHLVTANAVAGSKRSFRHDSNATASGSQDRLVKRKKNNVVLGDLVRDLPSNLTKFTLSQLGQYPHDLSLTQITSMLQIVQDRIFGTLDRPDSGFAEKHFGFTLTAAQTAAWPLHELQTRYVPLYMTTRYLADDSRDGWRNFFTQPAKRPHLVAAVLGEWLTQRVFKHTAFGFPPHLVSALEDKDREFLHYDAVVRSKNRARMMEDWYADWQIWPLIWEATTAAAESLADELLVVLHPLLPPPLFDPLKDMSQIDRDDIGSGEATSTDRNEDQERQTLRADIKADLINLIHDCAALHKGIRLTGGNGTIVRAVPNLEKGTRFPHLATAPIECVNPRSCNEHYPHDPENPAKLLIKMTCWPRFEAIVPSGPDLAELASREAEYRHEADALRAAGDTSASDDLGSDQGHGHGRDHDEFNWDDKDHIWPVVPESLQDHEGRHPGVVDPETGEANTVKRAAYVTIYPALCSTKVYCEWSDTPAAAAAAAASASAQYMGQAITSAPQYTTQSLVDAIVDARWSHRPSLRLRLEDIQVDVWNSWCLYGGLIQWGAIGLGAAIGAYRSLDLPSFLATGAIKRVSKLVTSVATGSLSSVQQGIANPLTERIRGSGGHLLLEQVWNMSRETWQRGICNVCGCGTCDGGHLH